MRALDDDGEDDDDQEFAEAGAQERTFVDRYVTTGNLELAARGTIVPVGASSKLAKSEAVKALEDSGVRAYFIDLMEAADLKPVDVVRTLKRNLTGRKYAIWQKTGEAIDIGPDSMGQIAAAKTILQGMAMINGGVKDVLPEKKDEAPPAVHLHFHQRPIDDGEDDDDDPLIIDGDSLVG